MWAVLRLETAATISVQGREVKLPLELMVGMIGALPVFATEEEAAAAAADGKFVMMEIVEANADDIDTGRRDGGFAKPDAGVAPSTRRRLDIRRGKRYKVRSLPS